MNCQSVQQLWENYLIGEVSSKQQINIQKHIADCSRCKNLKLASWLVKLKQENSFTNSKFLPKVRTLVALVAILLLMFGIWYKIISASTIHSIEIIQLESTTTYISEEGNTYYYYYLGDIKNED